MTPQIVPSGGRKLARAGFAALPPIIERAGPKASRRFLEFFLANIRNKNTRLAYARAVRDFLAWCESRGLRELERVDSFALAAYIEQLGAIRSAPTVKQHLAGIRMLFDYLVTGGVLPFNPAAPVRGPRHVVKKGKTPVLQPEEARALLDAIDTSTIAGLRDRALIGVMVYSFARVGAVVRMLLILPLIGLPVFEAPKTEHQKAPRFFIRAKGITAEGHESSGGFVVLAGSQAVAKTVPSIHRYLVTFRKSLVENGILETAGENLRFSQNYSFDSPSTAAGVVQGRSANGRIDWKDEQGRTLKDIQTASI